MAVSVPLQQRNPVDGIALKQVPQLLGSLAKSVHCPPQQPGEIPVHDRPHDPQFCAVDVLTQPPLQQDSLGPQPELVQAPQARVKLC